MLDTITSISKYWPGEIQFLLLLIAWTVVQSSSMLSDGGKVEAVAGGAL